MPFIHSALIYLLTFYSSIVLSMKAVNGDARSIQLVRFYSDEQETSDNLKTNELYFVDILTKCLNESDKVYIVFKEPNLNKTIQIDKYKDIKLNLTTQSPIKNKFTNYNLINYFSSLFNTSSDLKVFYSSVRFEGNQSGEIGFCVSENLNEDKQCTYQGRDAFVSFKVTPNPQLSFYIAITITLVALLFSALTSGLTLGLMSLDKHELQVLINAGTKDEKKAATKILPLRKKGNFLLTTFVVNNVLAESLYNYMLNFFVTSGYLVVIVSTVSLVLFGQILPLALSTRYGLSLGAKTIYLTYFFIIASLPIAYPLSWLLDTFLGEEAPTVYDKLKLIEYIKLTNKRFESDQLDMIQGVIYLPDKTVGHAMTKLKDVYMLPIDTFLSPSVVKDIFKKGFSRVPIYKGKRDRIVSILFLKDLVLISKPIAIKELIQKTNHLLVFTDESENIKNLLNYMKKGKSHMVIAKKTTKTGSFLATGIITLEDVIEEILQTEINDEADLFNKRNLVQTKSCI